VGLSPYSAPGVYSLLAGTELTDGVWYPRGGFGKARNLLLCDHVWSSSYLIEFT
jgi:phytoene desaturase (3,4-didehydrolycopene-forming)